MGQGSYERAAQEAEKNGSAKSISTDYIKLETPKEAIVGRILSVAWAKGGLSNQVYLQYMIETDKGNKKAAFGGQFDRDMGGIIRIGGVYKIVFLGKVDLGGGRSVRTYQTFEIDITQAGPTINEYSADLPAPTR